LVWHMQINGVHCLVLHWGEVFCEVVPKVFGAWSPDDLKLSLAGTVTEPVKSHVDDFGAALFDGVNEDAFGAFVVGSKHCGRLVVDQFNEHLSDGEASWAFMKVAATAAAEVTTGSIREQNTWIGPFIGVLWPGGSLAGCMLRK
jgi:hypothetical protein